MKHTPVLLIVACVGWLTCEGSADAGGRRHNGGAWGNYADFGYHGGDPYYRSSAYGPAGGSPLGQTGGRQVGYSGQSHVTHPVRQSVLVVTCCRPIAQCCAPAAGYPLATSP